MNLPLTPYELKRLRNDTTMNVYDVLFNNFDPQETKEFLARIEDQEVGSNVIRFTIDGVDVSIVLTMDL